MTINTTTHRAYPWPASDEPVSNGWDAIRDVAVAVDADLAKGTFTPQVSTAGTWTTTSDTGIWRRAGGLVMAWGRTVRVSGGLTSGADLTMYAAGLPAFASDLSGMQVGTYQMAGYGAGTLLAGGPTLASGFTALAANGSNYQPTFSGAVAVRFHVSYPAA